MLFEVPVPLLTLGQALELVSPTSACPKNYMSQELLQQLSPQLLWCFRRDQARGNIQHRMRAVLAFIV